MECLKYVTNLATPTVPQLATAQLLESSVYERHLRKVRLEYAHAVERMIEAVDRHFPEGPKVTRPQGGFVIWIEFQLIAFDCTVITGTCSRVFQRFWSSLPSVEAWNIPLFIVMGNLLG